ncbi:hypothetical protein [Fodinibius sp.]|uniref:hypothetical protein n=1 Tax=Fodinibius sp. TaxID=1872440 RepID=UPI00356951DC
MKKSIILNVMIIAVILSGCDGLNVSPADTVTEGSYWQRAGDAEIAVNAVYAEMDGRIFGLDNRTDIAYSQLTPLSRQTVRWKAIGTGITGVFLKPMT